MTTELDLRSRTLRSDWRDETMEYIIPSEIIDFEAYRRNKVLSEGFNETVQVEDESNPLPPAA